MILKDLLWVGLTGGMGCGKSSLASILRTLGEVVIDADQLVHQALDPVAPCFTRIVELFGSEIVSENGLIDRKKLSERVFSDSDLLQKLEQVLHPEVRRQVQEKKEQLIHSGVKRAFYDVPLLFEKKMEDQFDKIIVISCSEEAQYRRLKDRNGWTEEEIRKRLSFQWPLQEKEKKADLVLDNEGSLQDLEQKVKDLLKTL